MTTPHLYCPAFPKPKPLQDRWWRQPFAYDTPSSPSVTRPSPGPKFLPKLPKAMHSDIAGLYKKRPSERLHLLSQLAELTPEEQKLLGAWEHRQQTMRQHTPQWVEQATENALAAFPLPLGLATYFRICDRDVLVPMCTEEPSVIAAACHGAKMVRAGKGFFTAATKPISTVQIEIQCHGLPPSLITKWQHELQGDIRKQLVRAAHHFCTSMKNRGGGFADLTWRYCQATTAFILYLHVNTVNAMGANYVNSLATHLAQSHLPHLFPQAHIGLCIVSNLALGQMVEARCDIPPSAFSPHPHQALTLMQAIEKASDFAREDIFRATTHNKGIMNGIDAVAVATGNDWRALEAGGHAYASFHGRYQPLSRWQINHDHTPQTLCGVLRMPLNIGVVGGMTRFHPLVRIMLKILGHPTARELAQIMAAVGLAQNLAALKALCDEGIQPGHMRLHHKRTTHKH